MQIEHTIIEIGWPGGQKINNKKILFTIVPNIFSQNLNLKSYLYEQDHNDYLLGDYLHHLFFFCTHEKLFVLMFNFF